MSKADDLQLRAEAFADLSIKFVNGLPDTLIARRLGAQYLDASTEELAKSSTHRLEPRGAVAEGAATATRRLGNLVLSAGNAPMPQ